MSSPNPTTYPSEAHALPFRTIFGEYRARRRQDLLQAIGICILRDPKHYSIDDHGDVLTSAGDYVLKNGFVDVEAAWGAFDRTIEASEQAYRRLEMVKDFLRFTHQKSKESQQEYRARFKIVYDAILDSEDVCKKHDQPLKNVLHQMKGSAVCLSGGGIRSASFCLGVLQGLGRFSRPEPCFDTSTGAAEPNSRLQTAACFFTQQKPLLDSLDYLSTVSGGGYIGSWLMAWASRTSFRNVVNHLANPARTAADCEPQSLRHLREYTSYLAPEYGFSLDTMTLMAIVCRNLILNWLIIVPAILCLFCIPEFLFSLSYTYYPAANHFSWVLAGACLCISSACVIAAFRMQTSASHSKSTARQATLATWTFIVLLLTGAVLLSQVWVGYEKVRHPHQVFQPQTKAETKPASAPPDNTKTAAPPPASTAAAPASSPAKLSNHAPTKLFGEDSLLDWALDLAGFTMIPPFLMSLIRLRFLGKLERDRASSRLNPFLSLNAKGEIRWPRVVGQVAWSLIAPLLTGAFAALLLATGAYLIGRISFTSGLGMRRLFIVVAVPLILLVLMLSSSLLSGMLSEIEREEEREWWARAGGILLACTLVWIAWTGMAFFAATLQTALVGSVLGAIGVTAGSLGSAAGLSAATSSGLKKVKPEQLTGFGKWLSKHQLIAPVTCAVALFCIVMSLAALTSRLRWDIARYLLPNGIHIGRFEHGEWIAANFLIFVVAGLLAWLANLVINVNIFSLHAMYRMRLTRAYLGASNVARHPDEFTHFDDTDNLFVKDMPCSEAAPLHVINAALNVVATRNLAWQQRKAESFTFSAVSSGSWRLGYVSTAGFGGPKGVTMGTAMAISGAAFNPNMGYNSSPLVTLLMTFFNARLGWWLPNPIWPVLKSFGDVTEPSDEEPLDDDAKKFLSQKGPNVALFPLFNEALGNTNDTYKWIQLSDGGHFENLGLYEMVLRRCHSIIVVDADADCEYEFEDLGNAIRKIYIDLGIPIWFPGYDNGLPMKKGIDDTNVYCVRGRIDYDCVDGNGQQGEIILIKPVLKGQEPPDIRAYAASHPTFPHEATANQFFNESQLESYRHLGSWVIDSITNRPTIDPSKASARTAAKTVGNTVDSFFESVGSSPVDSGSKGNRRGWLQRLFVGEADR